MEASPTPPFLSMWNPVGMWVSTSEIRAAASEGRDPLATDGDVNLTIASPDPRRNKLRVEMMLESSLRSAMQRL